MDTSLDRLLPSLTKLVCTIGPASVERVTELASAGMSVARINLAHGTADDHQRIATAVRAAAAAVGREIGLLVDLPGPKLRLGPLAEDAVELRAGARFELRSGDEPGNAQGASVSYPRLAAELQPGDRVLIADGAVELRVVECTETVATEVVRGGLIRSRSGVNVPSERLSASGVRRRDVADANRAIALGADFIGLSFVRSAEDVRSLRSRLGDDAPAIVAKIETRPATEAIDEILAAADGAMVARGDLGVELPFEEVPLVQKRIVRAALARNVPVIVATQMLESMTDAPRPTRAEAGDVANAVFEGADAILLSAETAVGSFPIEAATAAVRILAAAEGGGALNRDGQRPSPGPLAIAAGAEGVPASLYVCHSESGVTAARIGAARSGVPVVAVATDDTTLRQLTIRHGILPVALGAEEVTGADALDAFARRLGVVAAEMRVALVSSVPPTDA